MGVIRMPPGGPGPLPPEGDGDEDQEGQGASIPGAGEYIPMRTRRPPLGDDLTPARWKPRPASLDPFAPPGGWKGDPEPPGRPRATLRTPLLITSRNSSSKFPIKEGGRKGGKEGRTFGSTNGSNPLAFGHYESRYLILSLALRLSKEESGAVVYIPLEDQSDIVPATPRPGVLLREIIGEAGKEGLSPGSVAQAVGRLVRSKNLLRSASTFDLGDSAPGHSYFVSAKGKRWLATYTDELPPEGFVSRPERLKREKEEAENAKVRT